MQAVSKMSFTGINMLISNSPNTPKIKKYVITKLFVEFSLTEASPNLTGYPILLKDKYKILT